MAKYDKRFGMTVERQIGGNGFAVMDVEVDVDIFVTYAHENGDTGPAGWYVDELWAEVDGKDFVLLTKDEERAVDLANEKIGEWRDDYLAAKADADYDRERDRRMGL